MNAFMTELLILDHQERLAEAEHARLIARTRPHHPRPHPSTLRTPLRHRMATALHHLADTIDPTPHRT
ncbi:hypothetical protein ACIBG7_09435 [Nonomuraea sp. NPDC050328]|uniref:hypothetical protein n=1 Tax=Nonomuraea sp. NPDC050328 TaxID=3364361 RepID=UPI0037A9904A